MAGHSFLAVFGDCHTVVTRVMGLAKSFAGVINLNGYFLFLTVFGMAAALKCTDPAGLKNAGMTF